MKKSVTKSTAILILLVSASWATAQEAHIAIRNHYRGQPLELHTGNSIHTLPPGESFMRIPPQTLYFVNTNASEYGNIPATDYQDHEAIEVWASGGYGAAIELEWRPTMTKLQAVKRGFAIGFIILMTGSMIRMAKRLPNGNVDL